MPAQRRVADAERAEIHPGLVQAEAVILAARLDRVIPNVIVDFPVAHRADKSRRGRVRDIRPAARTGRISAAERIKGQRQKPILGLLLFREDVRPLQRVGGRFARCFPRAAFPAEQGFVVAGLRQIRRLILQFQSPPGSGQSQTHRSGCAPP